MVAGGDPEDEKLRIRRRALQIAVPTNDVVVRERLRLLGQPTILFGEREMERRERLLYHLAQSTEGEHMVQRPEAKEESVKISAVQKSVFYTEGTADLLRVRTDIAYYSLPRAEARLEAARRKLSNPDEDEESEAKAVLKWVSRYSLDCSEIGVGGLTACSFSPDSSLLATSSRNNVAKVWQVPTLTMTTACKGHTEWLTDVAFSPDGTCLATGSADRNAVVWDLKGNQKVVFRGHMDRLARIAFHPSGNYLGTTSYDKTWRLWDVTTGAEVLLQEGHSRALYGIAFQCDGSLVASCGRDALTRVWDLRTGKSIAALEGHVKPVLSVDFSPNGYHLATGGEDHTCKVWDLRRKPHLLYTIPAHGNIISRLKYEPNDGYYLVTASFDATAKIWSARDFKPVKTLSGHELRVTGVDLSPDGQYIATVSHDRSVKLWSPKDAPEESEMESDVPDDDNTMDEGEREGGHGSEPEGNEEMTENMETGMQGEDENHIKETDENGTEVDMRE